MKPLTFVVSPTDEHLELKEFRGIVAGYTGRDSLAVQKHIDELAVIGVPPPPEIPMFYPIASQYFHTGGAVNTPDSHTSGEVEPAYIRYHGRYFLGIGSDHTDRDLEVEDIAASKRECPKPLGQTVIEIPDLASFSLDEAVAICWVDGVLYQCGPLSGLSAPHDVVKQMVDKTHVADDEDFICFGGTLPLLNGAFINGTNWRIQLSLPDGTTLTHTYDTLKGLRK